MARIDKRRSLPTVRQMGNLDTLPIELDISASKTRAVVRIAVGVAVSIASQMLPSSFAAAGASAAIDLIYQYAPLVGLIIGVFFIGQGVLEFTSKSMVVIENGVVNFAKKGLLGSITWSEPLTAFDGVRWRKMVMSNQSSSHTSQTITYQILELKHPKADRSIPLFITRNNADNPRAKWEHFAKLFALPAIDARDGQTRVRAAEDVDKSIRELATEGKLASDWDDTAAPPAGLAMAQESDDGADTILVTVLAKRAPVWLYGGALAIAALIFMSSLFSFQLFGLLIGAALGAAVVWMWKAETAKPRTIRITRSDIVFNQPMRGSGAKQHRFAHGDIEGVFIKAREDAGFFGKRAGDCSR